MTLTSPVRALFQLINRKHSFLAMCVLALGLMLASPITSTAQTVEALEITFDPALTQETSGDGDGIIEPGESGLVGFQVINDSLYEVGAIYIQADIDDYASVTGYTGNTYWYSDQKQIIYVEFDVDPNAPCGQLLNISLTIDWVVHFHQPHTTGTDSGSGSIVLGEAASNSASTFSYTGPQVAIPDDNETGVNIPLTVSGAAVIKNLNFSIDGSSCTSTPGATTVGLDHANVHDLVLKLTSPKGTTVTLMDRPGDETNTDSNFCNTVLDDNQFNPSIQSIMTDGAPYLGTFAPANPLSAFNGENPNGTWTLNVSDQAATNTGHVNAFSLIISGDFMCDFRLYSISGHVSPDGTIPVSSVMVNLTGSRTATSRTDINGNYTFYNLPNSGSYSVTASKFGYTFNPPSQYFGILYGDEIANFIATKTFFSISGRVLGPGTTTGLSGVTMNLTGARVTSVTTDADGNYTFLYLPALYFPLVGKYKVTPFKIGYRFTPATLIYSNLDYNRTDQNFTASAQSYTISGVVRLGAARLDGVTVTLSSPTPDGFPTRTATTSSSGAYSFTDLPAGRTYKVTPHKSGYQFTPTNGVFTNLSDNHTTVDFLVTVYSILGRVARTGTTTGISSVTMTITSPSPAGFPALMVQTGSQGFYRFTNLPARRNYTINPTKTGFTFSPATRRITNLSGNIGAGATTSFTGTGP